jgi:hypothetical protein
MITEDPADVGMVGQDPLVGLRVVVDPRPGPQLPVRRIRIGDEPEIARGEPRRPRVGSPAGGGLVSDACQVPS